jgi:hypothetical protein
MKQADKKNYCYSIGLFFEGLFQKTVRKIIASPLQAGYQPSNYKSTKRNFDGSAHWTIVFPATVRKE